MIFNIRNGNLLIKAFWFIIIGSFVSWLIALSIDPNGPQLDLFFIRMQNFWADATNVTAMIIDRNPYYGEAKGSYPPLAYLLFYPLMLVSSAPEKISYVGDVYYYLYYRQPLWTMLFVLFLLITLVLLYTVCIHQFKEHFYFDTMMTGIALCLSYPMLYVIERGNILLVALLALSVFVFYYDSDCKWKKEIALISLAVAAGLRRRFLAFY